MILNLYEVPSSSKINFSKTKPFGLEHMKIQLINKDKRNGHKFPLKYLELILVIYPQELQFVQNKCRYNKKSTSGTE